MRKIPPISQGSFLILPMENQDLSYSISKKLIQILTATRYQVLLVLGPYKGNGIFIILEIILYFPEKNIHMCEIKNRRPVFYASEM